MLTKSQGFHACGMDLKNNRWIKYNIVKLSRPLEDSQDCEALLYCDIDLKRVDFVILITSQLYDFFPYVCRGKK